MVRLCHIYSLPMDSLGWEHAPLVLYFVLIAGLLLLLAPSFARRITRASLLFCLLAALSLFFTWWYMLQYFKWSKGAAGESTLPCPSFSR